MANPFYFRNGEKATNVEEFYNEIRKVKAAEFDHHVSDEKNDFADWIEHIGKKTLANKVRRQDNITQLRKLLKKELGKGRKKKSKKKKSSTKKKPKKSSKKTKTKKTKKSKKTTKKKPKKKAKTKKKKTSKKKKSSTKKKETATKKAAVSAKDLETQRKQLEEEYRISTEAPHVFILKEFLFGALFGLVLGLILTALLIQAGVFF